MKLFKTVVVCLVLVIIQKNTAQGVEKFPFEYWQEELISIHMTVNDGFEGEFIFDTGSGIHAFSEGFFRKLDTQPAGYYTGFRSTGQRLDFELFQASSLALGQLEQKNPLVVYWRYLDRLKIDGVISLKFIEHQAVSLDFVTNEVIIEDEESLDGLLQQGVIVPITLKQDRDKALDIFADFVIGDTTIVELEIDTGSGRGMTLNSRHMCELIQNPKISLSGAPDIKLINPRVDFKMGLIYDGVIGIALWDNCKVTFDIPNKRLIINKDES